MDAFLPTVDWPAGVSPLVSKEHVQRVRELTRAAFPAELAVAGELHGIGGWLDAAPVGALLEDLLVCMIAADHWNARLVCPEDIAERKDWQSYLVARLADASARAATALTCWAVIERIPEKWLAADRVRTALCAWLAEQGHAVEACELTLEPPVLGGRAWVRKKCRSEIAALAGRSPGDAVAAVLHGPSATSAALIVCDQDRLLAFAPQPTSEGRAIVLEDLVGVDLLTSTLPPRTWLDRALHAVGLAVPAWRLGRRLRLRWSSSWIARLCGGQRRRARLLLEG